jgi:hypothetical protein
MSLAILIGGQVLADGAWIVGAIGLLPSTFLGWHLGPRARSKPSLGGSLETIVLMSVGVVILGDGVVSAAWSIFAMFGLGATGSAYGLEALALIPVLFVAGMSFVAWWIVFPVALAATAWLVIVRRLPSGPDRR